QGVDEFHGRKLGEVELVAEAMGVMVGGSGTLSTTLTYLLYELSRPENSDVQKRVREEILGIPDTDSISALRNNTYVNAVITETLRLYPSIVSTLPRVIPEPLQLGEHVIPAGTVVGMAHFVHQRDPHIFPEPERWIPERWLDRSEEMNGALTVFSFGKRACIGLNLAWEELYMAINAFVRAGVEIRLGKEMEAGEMEIEDRFAAIPRGKKLMLEVVRL
ncbi:cytochrome P450, partial [Candidatus Bathyarchaeota archaeon]|nr:cytochrome P450 [Candidatus Bathyarchaeota archaeon]